MNDQSRAPTAARTEAHSPEALLTEAEARVYAAHISGDRPLVAAVHDDLVRRSGEVGAPDFKTVALGLVGAEAHAAVLMRVDRAGYLGAYLAELALHGLIDLGAALPAPAGKDGAAEALPIARIMPQDAGGKRIVPQGWTIDMAEWVDMSVLTIGLARAMRRTCLVRIGGVPQGTGFLIGPQTVLTNWHVVRNLIDPASGAARPGAAQQLSCEFEMLSQDAKATHWAVENWLVDFSPLALNALGVEAGYPDMTVLRTHALDFCAIRLAGAPGRMRGWYDLGQPGQIDSKAGLIFVLQHPEGLPQLVAVGTGASVDRAEPAILRHHARTAGGSSGGLCLDHKLRVIGLHHAASELTDESGAPQLDHNRAILVEAIHKTNPMLGAADPMHDRICELATGERVVIGRADTQQRLRAMAGKTTQPVLYLRGAARSGKTFSADILRDSVESDQHLIVTLSPSAMPASARDLAALILHRAGATPAQVQELPQLDDPHGTDAAWLASSLLPKFCRALYDLLQSGTGPSRLLWLVLDQLDQGDIPLTSARDFLDLFYAEAQRSDRIRVLLIGLSAPLPGLDPLRAATEEIAAPDNIDPKEIETCIGHLLTSRGIAPLPDEIDRHRQLIQAGADMLAELGASRPRLERLSDVLARIYLKASRGWR